MQRNSLMCVACLARVCSEPETLTRAELTTALLQALKVAFRKEVNRVTADDEVVGALVEAVLQPPSSGYVIFFVVRSPILIEARFVLLHP